MLGEYLGAIVKYLRHVSLATFIRRRTRLPALVPNSKKPGLPLFIHKIFVGKIEAADIDDPDYHVLAKLMVGGLSNRSVGHGGWCSVSVFNHRLWHLQGLGQLYVCDLF